MLPRSLIALALFGCSAPNGAASRCIKPGDASVGPKATADAGPFTIRLPSADSAIPVPSIDSKTGGWTGRGHRITYDYGSYSNPLDSLSGLLDVRRCIAEIGGHPALIVTARDSVGRSIVAGHWARLHDNPMGPVSLTMYGVATDSLGRVELLSALRDVHFKP